MKMAINKGEASRVSTMLIKRSVQKSDAGWAGSVWGCLAPTRLFFVICICMALWACQPQPPAAIPTMTPGPTSQPTATLTMTPAPTSQPTATPTVTPAPQAIGQEVGLSWRECEVVEQNYTDRRAVQACFGRFAPDADERLAERTEPEGFRLRIGDDIYETHYKTEGVNWAVTLYKNDEPVKTLVGPFYTHSPDIALWNVNDKAAWEFCDHHQATIVYDGQDVRELYGVGEAYAPYDLGGKLVFVSMTDGKYQVMYDGQLLGPQFDEIYIAYCCDAYDYSIKQGDGRYLFRGRREGRYYLVEIEAAPAFQGEPYQ